MWESIRGRLPESFKSALSIDDWAGDTYSKTVGVKPLRRMRPPLLMRVEELDANPAEDTIYQFMDYGWRYGCRSMSLLGADGLVTGSVVMEWVNTIESHRCGIAGQFIVRVQSTIEHPGVEYAGPRAAVLYFPSDLVLPYVGGVAVSPIFGGPSDGAVRLVRLVAVALNLKIKLMEVDSLGGLLVLFNTFDPTLQLSALQKTWTP